MADILDGFSKKEVNSFTKEFCEVMRVVYGMDKAYSKMVSSVDLNRFRVLIDHFNIKYKGIKLKLFKTHESLHVAIYLNETNLNALFTKVAGRIPGLRSIGLKGFDEAGVEESEKFTQKIAGIKNEIYLRYGYSGGPGAVYMQYDDGQKMTMLYYDFNTIRNEESAELKLCAFYALKDEHDETIDIYSEAASFGFVDVLRATEKKKYMDKFEPRMLE